MPRRTDFSSIFIINAGPTVIVAAADFDFSRPQDSLYLVERFVGMMRD